MVLKKTMAILFSVMMLCTSLTASVYAETTSSLVDSGIAPAYEIASNPKCYLDVDGQTVYCTSSTYGINTVSITVEQTLQKQGLLWFWGGVKDASWTETVDENTITVVNTKDGLSDGKYRLKSVFTLTDKYGETETITIYSDERSI